MQVYSFGRISSRMSLNSPASFDQNLRSDPKVMMIFGLKLSRSDISDLDRTYPIGEPSIICGFFFSLFLLSHASLSCFLGPCLTLAPVMWSRSAQRSLKMLVDPPLKQRNTMLARSCSVSLLRSLPPYNASSSEGTEGGRGAASSGPLSS
jgi:hypothetical protein